MSEQTSVIRQFLVGLLLAVITGDVVIASEPSRQPSPPFFNGKNLTGWSASEMKYWSVKDNAIVDQIEFGPQVSEVSSGRLSGHTGKLEKLIPTPGTSNRTYE